MGLTRYRTYFAGIAYVEVPTHNVTLQIVLSTPPSHVAYAQGVRRLRRLCRETDLVPTSCKVPMVVLSSSARPLSQTAFSDVWSGELEGRKVAVKALRLHEDQVDHVRRVSALLPSFWRNTEYNATGPSPRTHCLEKPAPSKRRALDWDL
jgi:hypothetical protein